MICTFLTDDEIYKYFSNICDNLTPYSIAIGRDKINFLTPYFKFIKRDKIDYENNDDVYDYYLSNCGEDSFKNYNYIKFIQILIKFFFYEYILTY